MSEYLKKRKEELNNLIIQSNYKDKNILNKYLEIIYENFGDINEINNILNYSLKLNYHNDYDYYRYGICYMILKNYKKSQTMFEHSIKLNNENLFTYEYYGKMLLQSSQFDKLNNIIQIIKNIDSDYACELAHQFKSEILIENGEYNSAENILGNYICLYFYFYFFYFIFLF